MDLENLKKLEHASPEQAQVVLADFNAEHASTFSFPDLSKESKLRLVDALRSQLSSQGTERLHLSCLECLRILSRDKSDLELLTDEAVLRLLQQYAGLEAHPATQLHHTVICEAQKCLCNLIFNRAVSQHSCSRLCLLEGIITRLKTYKDPALDYQIKFYDMRLLFLLTALCSDTRSRVRNDLHGLTYLIEVLDLYLVNSEDTGQPLSDPEVDLCTEVLKILFNITLVPSHDPCVLDEEEEAHLMRLVSVLHDLLLCRTATKDKKEELCSHTVNLLTNMPRESFEELLTPFTEGASGAAAGQSNKMVEYDGKNLEAVAVLLDFLDHRLDVPKQSVKEQLTPILHSLSEICRANRTIRKYCRLKILPYLRSEVRDLPEEGRNLRNKLCRLFTHSVVEVKDLAADLVFVLCKENVERFVKYTGYGNAAGLLAQRGLMCGGRGDVYSSESEDSDTEEYDQLRPQVNPVTGRWEEDKPSPMAGMSEEQKEYEAMQLVQQIDKLQRSGVIQPMVVGADGKPRPAEHILELASDPDN